MSWSNWASRFWIETPMTLPPAAAASERRKPRPTTAAARTTPRNAPLFTNRTPVANSLMRPCRARAFHERAHEAPRRGPAPRGKRLPERSFYQGVLSPQPFIPTPLNGRSKQQERSRYPQRCDIRLCNMWTGRGSTSGSERLVPPARASRLCRGYRRTSISVALTEPEGSCELGYPLTTTRGFPTRLASGGLITVPELT